MPVAAWDEDGNPLVLNDSGRALQRASSYKNFHDVTTAPNETLAGVVTGGGWRIYWDEETPVGHVLAWAITTAGDLLAHFIDENGKRGTYSPGSGGKPLPPGTPTPGREGVRSGVEEKRLDLGNS